jgi:hypothetical protein
VFLLSKKTLWLLLADMNHPEVPLVVPTIAWIAKEAGVEFECYLETERNGVLFARTGSTVLGGSHHQQFNYLHAVYDVKHIALGETGLFRSSMSIFNVEVIASALSCTDLYIKLLAYSKIDIPLQALFTNDGFIKLNDREFEMAPYYHPEIYGRKALAFSVDQLEAAVSWLKQSGIERIGHLFLRPEEKKQVMDQFSQAEEIDRIMPDDNYATMTLRIAERWKHQAEGLAFGDPPAILSQIATLCREERISVYGELQHKHPSEIKVFHYVEETSEIAGDVIRLANELNNRVIVGRQTGDGDLFEWSKGGVSMKIMDPNRPAFPVVSSLTHRWHDTGSSLYDFEPDDDTLRQYAHEGKLLAALLFHSGEMAHNEAMLNLVDYASFTGFKMGLGVHAARYETSPQLWELIQVARDKGGVQGLIEPLLHSGGMGVLAEVNCPVEFLEEQCKESMKRIRAIAGEGGTPRGYYAFMDSDLATLSLGNPQIYQAIESAGLEYVVSSAVPGRNRILHQTTGCTVINQTSRSVTPTSPFVRITTVEDLIEYAPKMSPGWVIGTMDAPVVSFSPYIWKTGNKFGEIADWMMKTKGVVNVLPHTISRYARILREEGLLA